MAKTNAQRQKEYRARRNHGDGDYRLNTWISTSASLALARLAVRYGVTQRAMLERLVKEADDLVSQVLNDEEWDRYMQHGKDAKESQV